MTLRCGIAAMLLVPGILFGIWSFRTREGAPSNSIPAVSVSSAIAEDKVQTRDLGWPAMYGPQGNSHSSETGLHWEWRPDAPPVKWRLPIGCGYSVPVLLERDLILQHRVADEERLTCLDPETAKVRWEYVCPTKYQCKYEYSNGPYASPLIDGDLVFAVSSEAKLNCLSRSDGSLVWRRDFSQEFALPDRLFGFGAGLVTDDERLFLNLGNVDDNAGIVALDKFTGRTLWMATDHAAAYTMPRIVTVRGRKFLLLLTETGLVTLDPATGQEFSTLAYHLKAADTLNAVTPVVVDDFLLLVAGPGPGAVGLQLLPDGTFAERWKDRRVLDSQFNNLLHHAGFVYGFTSSRQGGALLRCIELASGKQQWEHASELGRGQSLAVDGKIVLLGERGHFGTIDLQAAQCRNARISQQPILTAPCYTAPALHRGLLYLRNEDILLCIDLRKSTTRHRAAESKFASD